MRSLNLRPGGRTLARRQVTAAAELPDPRAVLSGPLDPALLAIRADLQPHRRRLWLRRIVRRAWLVAGAVLAAEVAVFTLARIIPVELLPTIAAAIPVLGLVGLVWLAGRARPTLGETALAIDAEAHLGDRVASALALAVSFPELAAPATETPSRDDDPADESLQTERFVRRQRADAAASIRLAPSNLFRPRTSRTPAAIALVGALLLVPLVLLPNSQDAAIAQAQNVREEAKKQADRIDEIAKDLEAKGANPEDPRTRLAQELRDLARQLRERPEDLKLNLAKVSSAETIARSQLDPANEQRASSLASLSRSLSRAATGQPNANKDGNPKEAAEDLKELGDKLEELTPAERKELAAALAELQSAASQASGAAGTALRDAAQSLAQGNNAAAREALDRLGEAIQGAERNVDLNRDLARAASELQDARRNLANAGQQGQGQQGQQGTGQQGTGQQGQGQGGQGQGGSPAPGGGQGGSPAPSGQGQGQGQGQGPGPGPGPGSRAGPGPGSRAGPGPGSRAGPGPGSRAGPGPGRHWGRWVQRQPPGNRDQQQRRPGGTDEPEPARRPGRGPVEHLRAVRPARQARRSVICRRNGRGRAEPAGQPDRPGRQQRGLHAVPAGLRGFLRLRPYDSRPQLRPAVREGLRQGLLQLARPVELS